MLKFKISPPRPYQKAIDPKMPKYTHDAHKWMRVKEMPTYCPAKALREFLCDNNLTQAEVARILGVAKPTINAWVNGDRNMHMDYFNALMARAPIYLAGRSDEKRRRDILRAETQGVSFERRCELYDAYERKP